jgi:hypothetical protein
MPSFVPRSPAVPQAANHILVLDFSQSMMETDYSPTRLEAALQASGAYLRRLQRDAPTDAFAAVCFSNTARTLCPWTAVSSIRDIRDVLAVWRDASYTFGMGGTAIGAGLQEAHLLSVTRRGLLNVVLLTDGQHNEGEDPRSVAPRLKHHARIHTVGIGSPDNIDEELLRELASVGDRGQPGYRWIGDTGELIEHFQQLAGHLVRD